MQSQLLKLLEYNKAIRKDLQVLCEPLTSLHGLSLLTFRRFYNTGELFYIFNNPVWMDYCFQHTCWNSFSFNSRIQKLSTQKFVNYVWPSVPDPNDPTYCALYDHNIWNGVIMYRKYERYVEAFAFASTKENLILKNFYADGLNILNNFILYFKDKAHHLLHPPGPIPFIPHKLNLSTQSSLPEKKVRDFFQQTEIFKYLLTVKDKQVSLSKREVECLFYFAQGKQAKEVACTLGVSTRTIESHLSSARMKTESSTQELIDSILKERFILNTFSQRGEHI